MTPGINSPKYSLDTILPKLGFVLQVLFEEGRKNKPDSISYQKLSQEMPGDTHMQEAMLMGALAILHILGLIRLDSHGGLRVISSRYACYVLGSLSKFLNAATPIIDEPIDKNEKDYLVSLTKVLETAREGRVPISNEPLHTRRTVNVLIKSRQIRNWKLKDVYLHVYHPQWKAYHLVGLSHKDASKTDEEIAKLALEKQVGLMPDQYNLDPIFNPQEAKIKLISATSGALTEYTYRLMTVKEIRVKLRLKKLIKEKKFAPEWFRWFTWEEINQRESDQGEPIMFSTPIVLVGIDHRSIPLNASGADDVRANVDIDRELGKRFTYNQLFAFTALLVLLLVLQFLPYILSWLGNSNTGLVNLANIAQIIGTLIALGGVLFPFLRSRK